MKKFLIYLSSFLILFGVSTAFASIWVEDFEDGVLDPEWSTMGGYDITTVPGGSMGLHMNRVCDDCGPLTQVSTPNELIYHFAADIYLSTSTSINYYPVLDVELFHSREDGTWKLWPGIFFIPETGNIEAFVNLYDSSGQWIDQIREILGPYNMDAWYSLSITINDGYVTFGINGNETNLIHELIQQPDSGSCGGRIAGGSAGHDGFVDYYVDNLVAYSSTGATMEEIIGTWDDGIWYEDLAASKWTQMTSDSTTGDIAAGDFTGDGKADVASVWSDGLWYQDGATLAWTKIDSSPPHSVTAGDVTGDGRDEIIGTWSSGIRYWDFVASAWTQMTSFTPTGDIAAGDFTGDGKADVASVWSDGLWYQDGATLAWTKIDSSPPNSVTAGDVTGDGRDEIIGTWSSGIRYWDFVASAWTQMTSFTPTGDIAAGDFTGDGKADVASVWSDGLWYQDGATLAWTKISNWVPYSVTCGNVTDAVAGKILYDDFSSAYIDGSKWRQREYVREIVNGEFVFKLGNRSPGMGAEILPGLFRNDLPFAIPEAINSIECEVTIIETQLDSATGSKSFIRIHGGFYNRNDAGGPTGNIIAQLMIGDQGNGKVEVFWEVWETLADDNSTWDVIESGTISDFDSSIINPPYKVKLSYDGDKTFSFIVNDIYSDSFSGPEKRRDAVDAWKVISAAIRADKGSNNGYVYGKIDNVYINDSSTVYDDFSSPMIDWSKWTYAEWVREASNGYLRANIIGSGSTRAANTVLTEKDAPYFEAKVRIDGSSQLSPGAWGIGRIQGYFYNDSRGPGSGQNHNKYEGDVFVQTRLRYDSDGTLSANAYVDRSNDENESNFTNLFSHDFSVPIVLDTDYILSIRFKGKKLIFSCAGETAEYEIATSTYPAYGEHRLLRSSVHLDPEETGYMKVRFDDVYIEKKGKFIPSAPLLLLDK